ncbi:MAG: T9SS type A sorting domain-containing protein, partial [Bacteroidota bacterium]
ANDPAYTFLISDQNYRFSFNKNAVNPIDPPIVGGFGNPQDLVNPMDRTVHVDSMFLAGFVTKNGTFSFFNDHTLVGSVDSVVSVNVVLAGGSGYPIDYGIWERVAQMRMTYIQDGDAIDLRWNDASTFPPTYIGESWNGIKFDANEGVLFDLTIDPNQLCAPNQLPIELESFRAFDRGCQVELEWVTATETNNDFFILEESTNGFAFQEITRIDGAGTTTDARTYTYFDEDVKEGNYYRLTQVDFDGTSSTSPTIYVRSSCFDDDPLTVITDVFPNPVKPYRPLKVTMFSNKEAMADVVITNTLGQRLFTNSYEMIAGPNEFGIDVSNLVMGTYFVEVFSEGVKSEPFKFVIVE